MNKNYDLSFYKEHPKTCDPNDYWGQVKRTINGKPVPQQQIDMIVEAVRTGLAIEKSDILLDLCCGNGALTRYFFDLCNGGTGVDFSAYLIEVANSHFIRKEREAFILGDVLEFARTVPNPAAYTKALCYGSFMFLPEEVASELLYVLSSRFPFLERLYIGNIPDKSLIKTFFKKNEYRPGIENDPGSPIGIWRTTSEFEKLSKDTGWNAEITRMPRHFYAAHYRFDAILTPFRK